jgi:hypothetical protein
MNQPVTTDDDFVPRENSSSDKNSPSESESDDANSKQSVTSNSNESSTSANSANDSDRSNSESVKKQKKSKRVKKKPTEESNGEKSADEELVEIPRKSKRINKKRLPVTSSGEESDNDETDKKKSPRSTKRTPTNSPKISGGKSVVKPSGFITPAMKKTFNRPKSDEDETKIVEKKSLKNVGNESTEESKPTSSSVDQRRSPRVQPLKKPTSTIEKKKIRQQTKTDKEKPKEVSPTNAECNTGKRLVRTAVPLSEIKDWATSKEVTTLDELKQRCKEYSWKNCKINEQQLENWELPRGMSEILLVNDPKTELVRYGLFGIKRKSRTVEKGGITSSMNITNYCICCCNGSNNQRDAYAHDIQHGASYEDLLKFSKTDPTTTLLKFPETSFVMTITKKVATMLKLNDEKTVEQSEEPEPTGFSISHETEESELADSEEGRDNSQETTIIEKNEENDGESENEEKLKDMKREKRRKKEIKQEEKEKRKQQQKQKERDTEKAMKEKSKIDSNKSSISEKKTNLKPSEEPLSKTKTITLPNIKISTKTPSNPPNKSFGQVLMEVPKSKEAKDKPTSRKRKKSPEKEKESKKQR